MSPTETSGIDNYHTFSCSPVTYSPLVLNYKKPGREWTLSFRKVPEYIVILRGVEPTRDEMVEVISQIPWMPIMMVDIFMAAANSAKPAE